MVKDKKVKSTNIRKIIVLAFILLTLITIYVMFRGRYLELLEIGEKYTNIFWKEISYTSTAFGINALILFFMIFFTNLKIKKGLRKFFDEEKKEIPKLPNKSIALIFSIIISAVTTPLVLKKFMLCFNSALFEMSDPIFGYDISYFIFKKPFIELMITYFLALIIGLTIYTVIYYIIVFNKFFDGISRETLKQSHFTKQIISHIIIIVVLFAGLTYLGTHNMIVDKFLVLDDGTSYSLYGSGFADVIIKVWGNRILSVIMIISVLLAINAFKKGNIKKIILYLLATPVYLICLLILLIGIQVIMVNPNELDKEKQYISKNIEYTKKAYALEIDELNIENEKNINEGLKNNYSNVIDNIPVVSEKTLLKSLNTSQTAKGYYSYSTTQIANVNINGKPSLVYISPREITENISKNNNTYEYTHGYGVVITSAKEVSEDGDIVNIEKGFENNKTLKITQPRIYFGLQANEPIAVNVKNQKEFDYPMLNTSSAENKTTSYDGEAGLSLNWLDRFIIGINKGNLKLALSSTITKNSKILLNRNIIKRAKTLMPYLIYDNDPYLVVDKDGKLLWVLDAYTSSNNFPYSQMTTIQLDWQNKINLNYIRNSVKVLVNAYDGTTEFYITDRTDPIIMSYRNIYPDLFMDKDIEISEDIKDQFIYPRFLFEIQSEIISRYHNIQPDVLYRGDDIWDVATTNINNINTKVGTKIEPYYTLLKTIDSEGAKLGIVLPYTQHNKQNIISYLVGKYDNGYPVLKVYKFGNDSNLLGTMQLNTLVDQDDIISKEIDKLNSTGTKITKDIVVVPVDNTLLYVQSIYQQYTNESNSMPLLKKVIVAAGNKLAMGNNVKEAVENLLSQSAVDIEIESTDSVDDLVKAIIKANDNLEKSNNSNDWEMIGKDMRKLQELINKLKILVEREEKANQIPVKQLVQNTINE